MPDLTDTQLDQLIADIGLTQPEQQRNPGGRPPAPCGTVAAYQRHRRKGEPVDDPCRLANNKAKREQQGNPAGRGNRKPIAHGTTAGYQQHRYRGDAACEACTEAARDYQRERKAAGTCAARQSGGAE
jgi:hypothetical protein